MAGIIKTVTFFVMVFATAVFAEDYDVGDDSGWIRPTNPNVYSNWVSGKTFRVGDVLEFEFPTGRHDVATVTKQAYDSCNKNNPVNVIINGPAKVTLNTTGPHYFICTIADHCDAGQKLSINVVGTNGSSTVPTPTPGSPPTTEPTAPGTPSTVPPSPNSSAASSIGISTFLVAAFSSAMALMI